MKGPCRKVQLGYQATYQVEPQDLEALEVHLPYLAPKIQF